MEIITKNNYKKVMEELEYQSFDLCCLSNHTTDCDYRYFKAARDMRSWHFVKIISYSFDTPFKKDYLLGQELERLYQEVERLKQELEQEKLRPPELGGTTFKECENRYNNNKSLQI